MKLPFGKITVTFDQLDFDHLLKVLEAAKLRWEDENIDELIDLLRAAVIWPDGKEPETIIIRGLK